MRQTYLAIFTVEPAIFQQTSEYLHTTEGQGNLQIYFNKRLTPTIEDFLKNNPQKNDIDWGVFQVMTSEDFFQDFDKNFEDIYLMPEGIILPNGLWSEEDFEQEDFEKYKDGFLYIFFSIDE